MYHVLPTDRWMLQQSHDPRGYATINLHINDTVHILYCSDELWRQFPDLTSSCIYALYDDVISRAIACIKRNAPYIDLSEIFEALLPVHMQRWQEAGYIDN